MPEIGPEMEHVGVHVCREKIKSERAPCIISYRISTRGTLYLGQTGGTAEAPNIHPNVDGEVAYAAPINGLAVGYIQV